MKRLLRGALTLAAAATLTSGCIDTYEQEVTVNHHLTGCGVFERTTCIEMKADPGDPYKAILSGIEGFEFEWGLTHQLLVEVEEYSEPFGNDKQFTYKLIEILDQTAVPANFEFNLKVDGSDIAGSVGAPTVLGAAAGCSDADTCSNLQRLSPGRSLPLVVRYGADPSDPLTVVKILQ